MLYNLFAATGPTREQPELPIYPAAWILLWLNLDADVITFTMSADTLVYPRMLIAETEIEVRPQQTEQ